jgi:hypothetical protein
MTAREWMQQTGEHATEMRSLLGEELYTQVLADMDESAETVREPIQERAGVVGEAVFYLVVRTYRQKRSVRYISLDLDAAQGVYEQHRKDLRDGDVALWRCVRETTLARTSGGYNRTRW